MVRISSLTKEGIPDLWDTIKTYKDGVQECGEFEQRRQKQHTIWMWNYVRDHIMDLFTHHRAVRDVMAEVENKVATGECTPGQGADKLLKRFMRESS